MNSRSEVINPEEFRAWLQSPIGTKRSSTELKTPNNDASNDGNNKKARVEEVAAPDQGIKIRASQPTTSRSKRSSSSPKLDTKRADVRTPGRSARKPKVSPKKKQDTAQFPRPCERSVLRYLCQEFGFEQVTDGSGSSNSEATYRWHGQEFANVKALRTHLCQMGEIIAPSEEWFFENMESANPTYVASVGKVIYLPKTKKAQMIADWIRLDIVPEPLRTTSQMERLAKYEVQNVLRKLGVKAEMGFYRMDGADLIWNEVERKLATCGFSIELMEHNGATLVEKLSVLLYFVDYKTIVLQKDFTPDPQKGIQTIEVRCQWRRLLQLQKADSLNVQKPVNTSVESSDSFALISQSISPKSNSTPVLGTPQDLEFDCNELLIPFDVPFHGDEQSDISLPIRRELERVPPTRKKLRQKSVFSRHQKLQSGEFFGHQSACLLDFWDTLGAIRPKSDNFGWGKAIGYRRHMGRVYFDSFVLCEKVIHVGDFVKMDNQFFKIISAFQATRSFVGRWNIKNEELQNRGFAYVELVRLKQHSRDCFNLVRADEWNPVHVEGIPSSLFAADGEPCHLECVEISCSKVWLKKRVLEEFTEYQRNLVTERNAVVLASSFALEEWPARMEARHMVLYSSQREFALGTNEEYTAFDSDDSDDFDEPSMRFIRKDKHNWNEKLDCDNIDNDLEPAIMFTGTFLPDKDVDTKSLHDILTVIEPLFQRCVQCDESLKDVLSASRKEIFLRTATARLDTYFSLIPVLAKQGGGIVKSECSRLGFKRYKGKIQQLACEHVANSHEDTVMIAPCGSGKSMTFVHATVCRGKVNIVIEPLNALIRSQLLDLASLSAHIDVEQLFSEDEAKNRSRLNCEDRLQTIINDTRLNGWTSKPLLLFSSPELIYPRLRQLQELAEEGILSSVTVDEMDMIDRSHQGFRGVYGNLLEKLRHHCFGAKFIFLSATITTRALVSLLPTTAIIQNNPENEKPLLLLHERALADSLSFYVERKTSDEQVVERMISWIKRTNGPVKCLCYCLSKSKCAKISRLLVERGVTSMPVTSESRALLEGILESFRNGDISVLCCTGVLGRGFHVDDIRFVFHASVPLDLTEYIQQTGRGGRDGQRARCILFYRAQDFEAVRRIKLSYDDADAIRESVKGDIADVAAYAMSSTCRYAQLACTATIDECSPSEQRCSKIAPCDNCIDMGLERVDIPLGPIFESINEDTLWDFDQRRNSLSDDLLQMLMRTHVLERRGRRQLQPGANFRRVRELLVSGDLKFFIKRKMGDFRQKDDKNNSQEAAFEEKPSKVLYFDEMLPETTDPLDSLQVPFLLRFEAERVRQLNKDYESSIMDYFTWKSVELFQCLDSCKFLNSFLPRQARGRYESALPRLLSTEKQLSIDSFENGSGLYFHGELDSTNVIRLLPPERADSRRIFRKFGSHRFLHVNVASDILNESVIEKICKKMVLCGRTYSYLWCKAQKSPQCFVLFAESGFGIQMELSVDHVRDWCIPRKLNPELTVGKELKRMKLSFSKTTPTCVLGEKTIELIADITGDNGGIMTDGAGLVSRGALNDIWKAYSSGSILCPFASFQGRIGGFKGMWVLDDTLPGIKIKCRRSQLKFNVPMKSLDSMTYDSDVGEDPLYDTVEINSWDEKPEKGFLSVRLVQILERRGVALDFFLRCADSGLTWLDELDCHAPSSQDNFYEEIRKRHCNIVAMKEAETHETDDILFHMASAKLDPSEPYYAAQRRNFVKKAADGMRNKARYPMKDTWHVRMLPDHVQLLEEGEAFVALPNDARGSLDSAVEVLAFRNPSYFDGDLRKFKLVQYEALLHRAFVKDSSSDQTARNWFYKCQGFFKNLTSAIVLSTLGAESAAEQMSGGDFDGDKAWICFDSELVEQVADASPASRPDIPPKDPNENRLATEGSLSDRIRFARHFKNHQRQLGFLSNTLDSAMDMFVDFSESNEVDDIARQAFLQVDHLYTLCVPKLVTMEYLSSHKQPHWSLNKALVDGEQHEKAYKSQKAMGKLWDYVEIKIERAVALANGNEAPNVFIMNVADSACTRKDYADLQSTMRKAALIYNRELRGLMEAKASFEKIAETSQQRAEAARDRLIEKPFASEDDKTIAAAILYKECGDSKGFAWKVARDLLILIVVRAQNRGKSSLPLIMDPYIDKLAFGHKTKR